MTVGDQASFPARRAYSRGRRNPLEARPEAGRRRSHSAPQRLSRSPGSRLAAARRAWALAEHAGSRSLGCDQSARCRGRGQQPDAPLRLGVPSGRFCFGPDRDEVHSHSCLRPVNRPLSNFEVPAFPSPSPRQLSPATQQAVFLLPRL